MVSLESVQGNTKCLYLSGNCIPVYCLSDREWILMDSGAKQEQEELFAYLSENHINIRAVLTSHAHYDHVGSHTAMQERYGAEIIMPRFDAGIMHDSVSLKACFYSCTRKELENSLGEMVCSPDRVMGQKDSRMVVVGNTFGILDLPGHAASHVGYVTPDGVAYIADSLVSPEVLSRSKLLYMLEWRASVDTMKKIGQMEYPSYILAHYGVYRDIRPVVDQNLHAFDNILGRIQRLSESEFTLEHMVRKIIRSMELKAGSRPKARLIERMTRSIMEYMVDTGRLQIGIRDGLIVYRTK